MYFGALKLLLLMGRLLCVDSIRVSLPPACPLNSLEDLLVDSNNYIFCYEGSRIPNSTNVIEVLITRFNLDSVFRLAMLDIYYILKVKFRFYFLLYVWLCFWELVKACRELSF